MGINKKILKEQPYNFNALTMNEITGKLIEAEETKKEIARLQELLKEKNKEIFNLQKELEKSSRNKLYGEKLDTVLEIVTELQAKAKEKEATRKAAKVEDESRFSIPVPTPTKESPVPTPTKESPVPAPNKESPISMPQNDKHTETRKVKSDVKGHIVAPSVKKEIVSSDKDMRFSPEVNDLFASIDLSRKSKK